MIRPSRPIFFALFSSFPVLAFAAPDWKAVEPILAGKCYSCHGGEDIKGEVDMKALAADPKLDEQFELWHRVLETIESGGDAAAKSEAARGVRGNRDHRMGHPRT
jgi:hypothetical protein